MKEFKLVIYFGSMKNKRESEYICYNHWLHLEIVLVYEETVDWEFLQWAFIVVTNLNASDWPFDS